VAKGEAFDDRRAFGKAERNGLKCRESLVWLAFG
jgi:hypothetical protein